MGLTPPAGGEEAGGELLLRDRELRGRTRRRGRRVPPHLLNSHHSFYDGLYVGGVADARIRPALRTLKQNMSLLLSVLIDRVQPVAVQEASEAARRSDGKGAAQRELLEHNGLLGGEEGDRSGSRAGNRWPRQETLALLKIRSEMDVAFREAVLKGPL
ncbi:hypothetical protein [Oryza sativa Japonica Group]|uniref:PATROL1-like C-terminal domain-containing protein n=2 Tax=Oryza sativa subsp. japonica TaxID=39947 RepID=Q7F273_ORYSJ|nr:hypothetical protein [Oryza sativa Japonica Group]BAB90489.1 hypothetical protein [Oryza sativa Japonica Group]